MVGRKIVWTNDFERSIKKIKDEKLKKRVIVKIKKIVENPGTGKPLKHSLKGERTEYISPYRIIYSFTEDLLIFLKFKHRKGAYKAGS